MKHFFPFLATLLILCVLLHTFPIISVSAQQHHSFASAKYLPVDHSVSIILPANASEYYYFLSLHSTNPVTQNYQIVLSRTESLSVSVYDDQGSAVNLKNTNTGKSNWTGYINNISDNERFFLVLHNQSNQDISLHLSVKSFDSSAVTASPKPGSTTKKTATAKPGKKVNSSSTPKIAASQKPRRTPKGTSSSKTAATQKSQNTSKQTSSSKTTSVQKQQSTSKQTSSPNSVTTPKPKSTSRQTSPSEIGYSDSTTVTPSPRTTPAVSGYHTISRSDALLANHFFRISAGYSISAFELLSIHISETELALENMSPETISLQNNIIFAKSPGLAVIRIHYNGDTTSCTIYVQNTP